MVYKSKNFIIDPKDQSWKEKNLDGQYYYYQNTNFSGNRNEYETRYGKCITTKYFRQF